MTRGTEPVILRTADGDQALPSMIEIKAGDQELVLRLKRLQPLNRPATALGTGTPPPGLETIPLESLEVGQAPVLAAGGED